MAHSIHEIAKLIGQEKSEQLLTKFLIGYLADGLKEVRTGAIRHLHEFLGVISEGERLQFLNVFKDPEKDKTMTDLYAENIGDFSLLFPVEKVTETLLPTFYTLCQSKLSHVRKLAAQNFAKILEVYKEDSEMQEGIIQHIQTNF